VNEQQAQEVVALLGEISDDLKDIYNLLLEHGKELSQIENHVGFIAGNVVGSIGH
jgi:hypothetical protein